MKTGREPRGAAAPDETSRLRLAEALKAIADPVRLRILAALKKKGCCSCVDVGAGEPGLCVCDVVDVVDLGQSTASHHLAILQRAGLVTAERRGQWMYYRRNEEAIRALADQAKSV